MTYQEITFDEVSKTTTQDSPALSSIWLATSQYLLILAGNLVLQQPEQDYARRHHQHIAIKLLQ